MKHKRFANAACAATFWLAALAAACLTLPCAADKRQTLRFRLPMRGFAPQHVSGVADAEYIEDGGVGILDMPPASAAWLKAGE